jgi:hypothetical protein
MAFPGTMPVVNKQAVINAVRVANALHMSIDHTFISIARTISIATYRRDSRSLSKPGRLAKTAM